MTPIRHILFDLGGTLMHARGEWAENLRRADQALTDTLREYEIELDSAVFRQHLHQYYDQRDKDLFETTYHFVLRELLKEMGYAEVAEISSPVRFGRDVRCHTKQLGAGR